MKRTSIYVDGRRKNANGEYPIFIRVFDELSRQTFKISAGMTTPVVFKGREFPKSVPNSSILTTRLNDIYRIVELECLTHSDSTLNDLKKFIAKALGRNEKNIQPKLFIDYIKKFMATKTNPSTISLYNQTLKKVIEYDKAATFETITPEWLMGYEKHFRRTMTINGLAISMRNIRAVFNWCLANEYTVKYPFRRYKVKQQQTRKRCLTIEQLRQLRDYPLDDWLAEYRDMFMLQFYLIGINISDLLLLPGLKDGRCVYYRKKTGRLYDIAAPDEAVQIINKYKGKKQLLCPLDRYKDATWYKDHINRNLKKIGPVTKVLDKVGKVRKLEYHPLFPEISTYWARHTWATIAASLDIPKETIGKALGHSEWDNTTTDIYINFDNRKIDEANRKVIDYVNSDVKQDGGAVIMKLFG